MLSQVVEWAVNGVRLEVACTYLRTLFDVDRRRRQHCKQSTRTEGFFFVKHSSQRQSNQGTPDAAVPSAREARTTTMTTRAGRAGQGAADVLGGSASPGPCSSAFALLGVLACFSLGTQADEGCATLDGSPCLDTAPLRGQAAADGRGCSAACVASQRHLAATRDVDNVWTRPFIWPLLHDGA